MTTINYYEILGINKQTAPEEIKQEYRRLARLRHPDNGGTGAEFALLNEAYSTMIDPLKRSDYEHKLRKEFASCDTCHGTGVMSRQQGFTKAIKTTCTLCEGAGIIF